MNEEIRIIPAVLYETAGSIRRLKSGQTARLQLMERQSLGAALLMADTAEAYAVCVEALQTGLEQEAAGIEHMARGFHLADTRSGSVF